MEARVSGGGGLPDAAMILFASYSYAVVVAI